MLGFLYWILFGALIGFIANLIDQKNNGGLLSNIIVGIIGAMLGGWLAGFFGFGVSDGFNVANIIVSVIGSLIVLAIFRLFGGR